MNDSEDSISIFSLVPAVYVVACLYLLPFGSTSVRILNRLLGRAPPPLSTPESILREPLLPYEQYESLTRIESSHSLLEERQALGWSPARSLQDPCLIDLGTCGICAFQIAWAIQPLFHMQRHGSEYQSLRLPLLILVSVVSWSAALAINLMSLMAFSLAESIVVSFWMTPFYLMMGVTELLETYIRHPSGPGDLGANPVWHFVAAAVSFFLGIVGICRQCSIVAPVLPRRPMNRQGCRRATDTLHRATRPPEPSA